MRRLLLALVVSILVISGAQAYPPGWSRTQVPMHAENTVYSFFSSFSTGADIWGTDHIGIWHMIPSGYGVIKP